MHLFHKWTSWSTVQRLGVYKVYKATDNELLIAFVNIQQRECLKCGRVQVKRERVDLT